VYRVLLFCSMYVSLNVLSSRHYVWNPPCKAPRYITLFTSTFVCAPSSVVTKTTGRKHRIISMLVRGMELQFLAREGATTRQGERAAEAGQLDAPRQPTRKPGTNAQAGRGNEQEKRSWRDRVNADDALLPGIRLC
jgi:hypothetical protein